MSGRVTSRFITSTILLVVGIACRPPVAAAQDTDPAQNVVYHYQPENGGLVFRASVIPSLRWPDLVYWAGISFGVAF